MKQAVSQWLLQRMRNDERVIFLTGDLGFKTFEPLLEEFPERAFNVGVSEQNMIGVAAGLATQGLRPFCYSIAPFLVLRALEQIRNDLCFQNLPVVLLGNGGGLGYGLQGSSHHLLEDIAVLSSLPQMRLYFPMDRSEVHSHLNEAFVRGGPAYFRLSHELSVSPVKGPDEYNIKSDRQYLESSKQSQGPASLHHWGSGKDVGVFAIGNLVARVRSVLHQMSLFHRYSLFQVRTLPLQFTAEELKVIKRMGSVLVFEEHHSLGGLASQLALQLLQNGISKPFRSVAVPSYWDHELDQYFPLLEKSGLGEAQIREALTQSLKEDSFSGNAQSIPVGPNHPAEL